MAIPVSIRKLRSRALLAALAAGGLALPPSPSLLRADEPPAAGSAPAPAHPADNTLGGTTDPAYRLSVGDSIGVSVYGETDLSSAQRIDSSGKIRLPLLDEVEVAELSVREAEKSIEKLFRDREFLKDPLVEITVSAFAPREASVNGAVREPGIFEFPRETKDIDIVDLISRVGGFLPTAKSDSVKVTRRSADGQETVMTVDVESMMSGRRSGRNQKPFFVLPDDRVWVPERLF